MAGSPQWKVYDAKGGYQASCKELEACAALMGLYGDGATIRHGHRIILWTEGSEWDGAATESYDHVAAVASARAKQTAIKLAREMVADRDRRFLAARTSGRGS